ncbi:MAG: class I SAM-dependent methyltransferase [Myxococcales bacterium]|nr:class I SAM-dependent methyltransferase [Myxococcales bacterium]
MKKSVSLVAALVIVSVLLGGCARFRRWSYESGNRDAWQQPARVIEVLEIPSGRRLADLGSGGGYFSFRLAEAVGPDGHVYAVDVDADLNELLAAEIEERGLTNLETILADPTDPRLPEDGVDLLFTCNTYHHLPDRVAYFRGLRDRIRPGGRVAIIDYRYEGFIQKRHATPAEVVRSEMAEAGYTLTREYDFLERQNFMIFQVTP